MSLTRQPLSRHIGTAVLIASLFLLSVAQEVLVPIALAALLAVLLTPIVVWLARRGIPDLLAVFAVVGTALVVTGFAGWLILGQLNDVVSHVPEYRDNLHHRLSALRDQGKSVSAVAATVQDLRAELNAAPPKPAAGANGADDRQQPQQPRQPVLVTMDEHHTMSFSDVTALATSSLRPLAVAFLVVLLATFMIAQRADIHRRFTMLTARMAGTGMHTLSTQALDEVTGRITHYLVLQSLFNLTAGTIVAVTLLVVGLPNALLWGLLTAVLRFVPYAGILLVTGLTCLFAIAVSPDWHLPLLVLALFTGVELLIGNVAEPLFFAHGTGLSTLAVLIATAFWTWIWGSAGLVLAIPLTVCLVALGRHVPSLGYLHILLAKDPRDEPHPPAVRGALPAAT